MTTTFKLSEPLTTHDGALTELKLKAPRAGAFVKYNDPFTLKPRKNEAGETDGIEFTFNNASMMKFLANMAGVDDLILEGLSGSDFLRLRSEAANLILGLAGDKDPSEQSVA